MTTKILLAVLRLHLKQILLFLVVYVPGLLFVCNYLWDIRTGLPAFYSYQHGETEEMAR